ncbi:hypothetical protein EJB05_26160, partial [Eragrostis curvula]
MKITQRQHGAHNPSEHHTRLRLTNWIDIRRQATVEEKHHIRYLASPDMRTSEPGLRWEHKQTREMCSMAWSR